MSNTQKLAHKMLLSSSLYQFTTKMFPYLNRRPYIVGQHHLQIMDALDKVVRGECNRLIINIGPRFGKTELVSRYFIAYCLAIAPDSKFLHLSYSGSLTQDNSIAIKDIINSEYYQAVFDTRIKFGSDTKSKWDTEQGGGVYATSTLGQITGFGAGRIDSTDGIDSENTESSINLDDIDKMMPSYNPNRFAGAIVIDDPLKPDDALSDNVREKVNLRFETTIRSRVNSRNTPIIVIMQRLHEHDLCGYLMEQEPDEWTVLSLPALYNDENGVEQALWPFKMSVEECHKLQAVNSFVFETQYMQNPKPLEGLMYRPFNTYEIIPFDRKNKKVCYCDPADTGADWLCAICYIESPHANYVTDVLFTKKDMDFTQQAMANMLVRNGIDVCHVEANGAGRIFSKNVERICREMGDASVIFHHFAQTKNKQVRLFSHSNEVNNMTIFPSDWERRWPDFANQLKGLRKEGGNAHEDSADACTGAFEMRGKWNINTQRMLNNML